MLLAGSHGTTKHVVRPNAFQWKHVRPFKQHFATAFSGSRIVSSKSEDIFNSDEKSYAVLGGGVTGLSAAYFLTRKFPGAKVTIYEATKRLGGWVDSEIVEVDGGQVLFEWGPRSLRPDLSGPGKITAQLIRELNLAKNVVATHRDHVAARNRFIYYPDHLVRMPAPYPQTGVLMSFFRNLQTILSEPIFKGMIGGILSEPTVSTRPKHLDDESVGDFVRRRFGPTIADNMLSALFHGIYAGDIYKLSARTLLPKLWYLETRDPEGAGIIPELFELTFKNEQIYSTNDARILREGGFAETEDDFSIAVYHTLAQQSVYTFINGIEELTTRLEEALLKSPHVQIATDAPVSAIDRDPESRRLTVASVGEAIVQKCDYVISTLSPTALGSNPKNNWPLMLPETRDATTVMVVNLYYSNPNLTYPYRGFGYLIPQSIPMEENPERALGVIFASETSGPRGPHLDIEWKNPIRSFGAIDKPSQIPTSDLADRWATNHQDTAPGTKLTVMMGGHWWADWTESDIPSPETAVEMAKSLLARHMNIFDEPVIAKARLQKDAIPQYHVGHRKSMAQAHLDLQGFQGKLRMAGPAWQGGVGVNDCIRRAWEIVDDLGEGEDRADGNWKTGLENFARDENWVTVERKGGKILMKEGND